MKKIILYIKYYFEPSERLVSKLAFDSAKEYYSKRPLKSSHPMAHYQRREDFVAYQRGFKNAYRSNYAKAKVNA